MPIRKLRSLSEAEQSCWRDPDDPMLWKHIASLWRLARVLAKPSFPPGVYRHRSIEEAGLQTKDWERRSPRLPRG